MKKYKVEITKTGYNPLNIETTTHYIQTPNMGAVRTWLSNLMGVTFTYHPNEVYKFIGKDIKVFVFKWNEPDWIIL
jgi:hypothetical protein